MTLFWDDAVPRPRREIAPGAVHLPGWLTLDQQQWIVARWREWAAGPVPPHSPVIRGHPMSVRTLCLGWHWQPYRYTRTADDVNGRPVLDVPAWLVRVGRRAVADAYRDEALGSAYLPDTVLVNHYPDGARMSLHQDRDERSTAPIVSLSIGDTARFRFGNTRDRNRPWTDLELVSGDLFVFGGPTRFAFHGVRGVVPASAPPECGLETGRLNLTLRETGLA